MEPNQEKQRQEKGEGHGMKKQKERDNQEGQKRGKKETLLAETTSPAFAGSGLLRSL